MVRAFCTTTLLFVTLLASPSQSLAQPAPSRPPRVDLIPCGFFTGEYTNISSVVIAFSEGTAWESEKWVWLSVFNPQRIAQTVEVNAYVDGYGLVAWSQAVPAKSRSGWNMNVEIFNRTGRRGRVNFATEVVFVPPLGTGGGIGVANLAVWDYNYQSAAYLTGTNLCGRRS